MDRHEVTEPAPTAEQPSAPILARPDLTPPPIDTNSIVDHHDPADASSAAPYPADLSDNDDDDEEEDDGDQTRNSSSEADDADSDFDLAQMQTEDETDDDIKASGKKHSRKIETEPLEIEELHEEWHKWEDVYTGLQHKARTIQLSNWQRSELRFSRKKLDQLFKKIPKSDPLKSTYSEVLNLNPTSQPEAPKRKNRATGKAQTKKPRLAQTRATKIATNSGSQIVSQQAAKQHASRQITNQLHLFKEQGENAGIEPKKLKSEVKNLELALNALGQDLVTPKDGSWLIEGMKTPLFDYQLDGVGWAMRRERSHPTPENPRGGILADQMGCGKTITMLAVMVAKPAPKSYKVKANLLLVQNSAAVRHWQIQIRKHCNEDMLPAFWYSQKSGLNARLLKEDQIIIMTYGELQRAWARIDEASQNKKSGKNNGPDLELDPEKLLFDSVFHRLILDECQYVKNHNGATAKAVFQLKSRIQWLVSATPAPNSTDEYFPYFKILGLRETDKLSKFRAYWLNKLETSLEKFQLHRTHETKVGGVGILADVPESDEKTQIVTMSDEERAIYEAVVAPVQEQQTNLAMRIREQKMNQADACTKEIQQDLKETSAMILQLHKITAHPFLLESIIQSDDFSVSQTMEICELAGRFRGSSFHGHAKDVLTQVEAKGFDQSPSADTQPLLSETTSYCESGEANMETLIDYALGEKAAERRCYICPPETIPIDAVLSECGHAFCRRHFSFIMAMSQQENPEGPHSCTVCEKPIGTQQYVDQTKYAAARAAFLAATRATSRGSAKSIHKGEKRSRKRGDDFNGYQPRGKASAWLDESDRSHPKIPLAQSSKTQAVLQAIESWQEAAPDDKIIVFTQWVMMGKILGRSFEDKDIKFVYYFGEMSDMERSKNLQTFSTDPDVNVIIMGFRCGGQGLDMYYANRVILVDPWWNDDGEAQGFARVKRKIQKKKTFFLRLMAKDSIDMRVAAIQRSKREMTQRLRKEDDPLKRSEIEIEYGLKACELGLSSNFDGTEPDEDPEQCTTNQ